MSEASVHAREVWVLGATGRTGAGIARHLAARGLPLALVGRDALRLADVARTLGDAQARVVALGSIDAMIAALGAARPSVVVSTVGPFAENAVRVAKACPPGTHYVDVSNELVAVRDVLALDAEAHARGSCLVPAAGYGVVATESLVRRLCEGRSPAARVRVDALPFIAGGDVVLGEALAATIVDGLGRGGVSYQGGALRPRAPWDDVETLTLPEGGRVRTAGFPSGDLEAAHRASGAPDVVSASSEVPVGLASRVLVPLIGAVARWPTTRGLLVRRLASFRAPAPRSGRASSWSRARVVWADGTERVAWMRTGDGMAFTNLAAAEVAARLARGEGRAGAHTPCELFGTEIAERCGGEITLA